ncbi:MAG: glutamate--tRNA ligase [Spirochaetes bacterium]|nr:glutamate--tRNA ligase [Spirochaetota bacterium]
MNTESLADALFPDIKDSPAALEARFPKRSTTAPVTRFAPSPTGYLHIGGLLASLVSERFAHQSGGIFFLRIEDTDKEREVPNGIEEIISAFSGFGITFDEGPTSDTAEKGSYGPYIQSKRADIYKVYIKELVRQGKAYPCFCTSDDLSKLRSEQEAKGAKTGYYADWAKHRALTPEQAAAEAKTKPFVIRLKSSGSETRKISFDDCIRGTIEMPENDFDAVIMKADGIPTYHFAHAVDDHLMRTTHVIRGEEWLSSVPLHLELFATLGFETPRYAHIAPIMKQDGESRRKLSKRHDPEAAVRFYHEQGYPVNAVIEYLMNIIDGSFERWRVENPAAVHTEFKFDLSRMSKSGGLFDMTKLNDVSQNFISRMSAESVYESALRWAEEFKPDLHALMKEKREFTTAVFNIGRGDPKARKDIRTWADVPNILAYCYDELFPSIAGDYVFPATMSNENLVAFLTAYKNANPDMSTHDSWYKAVLDIATGMGFAPDMKTFKKNPGVYKGQPGELMMSLRIAVLKIKESPDLYSMFSAMGHERARARIDICLNKLR